MAAPVYAIGQRVTADLLSTLASYIPVSYTKAATDARASTTTLADDPELKDIPLAIGSYEIELTLYHLAASTTPKLKTRWAFTGTYGTPLRGIIGPGSTNVAAPGAVTPSAFGVWTVAQDAGYGTDTGGRFSMAREYVADLTVTVAGNLSLQWAQVTSNASSVSVCAGSTFKIRKK